MKSAWSKCRKWFGKPGRQDDQSAGRWRTDVLIEAERRRYAYSAQVRMDRSAAEPPDELVGGRSQETQDVRVMVPDPVPAQGRAQAPAQGQTQAQVQDLPSIMVQSPTQVHFPSGQTTNQRTFPSSDNTRNAPVRVRRPAPPPPPRYPLRPSAPLSETLCRNIGLPVNETNAPPRRPNPEEEMLQQLSCPICLDLFTDPVLLPCLHSLCRACSDTLRAHVGPFLCPECKQDIGREPLKKNFPLNNLVEIFKRDAKTRKRTRIPEPPVPLNTRPASRNVSQEPEPDNTAEKCACCVSANASVCCVQCSMAFCSTCLIDYHPTVETTPEHTLLPAQIQDHTGLGHRLNVQDSLCNVMGTMSRVHAEMLQSFSYRRRP